MTLGTAQSWAVLVITTLMVIVLIRILVLVHKQSKKVDDIEAHMKLMQKVEDETAKKEKL